MAKFLQDLLQAEEPLFSLALRKLEQAAGHSGVDVRLISDIILRAHHVMRQIGLDPADTTSIELHNALLSHADDRALFAETEFVGLSFNGQAISFNFDDIQENVGKNIDQSTTRHMQFCLRHELVRRYGDHERVNEQTVEHFVQDAGLAEIWYNQANDQQIQTDEKEKNMEKPYILAIGDIFTDAFIKLREDKARIDTDPDGSKRLSLPFGSKPPYDSVEIVQAVGPSPNAAVAFSRLGLNAGLMAFLGDDQPGKDSLAYLYKENVDTSTMLAHAGMKSNYYYVLRYGADRTILVKNEEYDYHWITPEKTPDWIYLSLISEASWQLHEDLLAYLEAHPDTKFAFQPGTFHFEWGAEKLAKIYARSHIVVMNREEAVDVTGKSYDSLKELADGLHALGPKIVVITDGPNGSYASYDGKLVTIPNYPDPAAPVDRTGAGDAFASTIVAALALGESIETALTWAPINSMNVVQHLGAQAGLLRREDVDRLLESAPENYRAKEIN
jgi:sugar/nucleoside kinase (ribokinase family)